MVMFLMILCMSLFGLALTALAFGAATGTLRQDDEIRLDEVVDERLAAVPERFFVRDDAPRPTVAMPKVPLEVLLTQIDRHVRLEQAAAESFINFPSRESLHGRTLSPLAH
jgi:hypothetical protein